MAPKSTGKNKKSKNAVSRSPDEVTELIDRLEKLSHRFDVAIDLLLEIKLSNSHLGRTVSYTDKASLLESKGMELKDISRIVGRPSNWVSSRLRESKLRKQPRPRRAFAGIDSSHPKGDNRA